MPRVIAVDWSGAKQGAARAIWLAEVVDGRLIRLESGRTREQIADFLIAKAELEPEFVVGLDFAFSLPSWFLESLGIEHASQLWERMSREGEEWIREPPAPFWRSRRSAPETAPDDWEWRATELRAESIAGVRAKSVFQLVGAGHVGTGSLRGMPVLHRLREHGFRVWPFDEPAFPLVVEIYPRLLTGAVNKSDARARAVYLTRFPELEARVRERAAGSEDAFDAAVSALVMAAWNGDWTGLPREAGSRLEGAFWRPAPTARRRGPADRFAAARDFLYREARVVEQRLFATLFEGASPQGVVDAVLAYRNDDGGFGHGLEPDKRGPDSQPLDVAFALDTLAAAGAREPQVAARACDFLETVAEPSGAVPMVLPSIAAYPRAEHWGDGVFPARFAPAASIAGRCHELGVPHPWVTRATAYCFDELEHAPSDDAHALAQAVTFLEHAPDRERAERLLSRVVDALATARWYRRNPASDEYGLTPLRFAPGPDAALRPFFTDEEIEAHLDRLESDQQPDGGWPLAWTPPSAASSLEWRGIQTLAAIRVLVAYARLGAGESSSRAR